MPIFTAPIDELVAFIDSLNEAMALLPGGKRLSSLQKKWLGVCLTGVIVTHSLCWQRIERSSAGRYKAQTLSFMLHWAKISWHKLFIASTLTVLRAHGVKAGILVIDDDDRPRSKSTTTLFGVHKVKDKKTGGYTMAQNIVKMVLVTPSVTIPVGFDFFRPDPALSAWTSADKKLRKAHVPRAQRPQKPERNADYPSRQAIAAHLIRRFKALADFVKVEAIAADAAYMSRFFRDKCHSCYPKAQVVSRLRLNQNVGDGDGRSCSLEAYFKDRPTQTERLRLRGTHEVDVIYSYDYLVVNGYGTKKLLIVAVKYEKEAAFRYLVACDATWRPLEVMKAYGMRWLVEVVIEDWKLYEGWGKMASQHGEDGARRGLCLSLLLDHFLLQHPQQLRLSRSGQPLQTVGTLLRKLQANCLVALLLAIFSSSNQRVAIEEFALQLDHVTVARDSTKHQSAFADALDGFWAKET